MKQIIAAAIAFGLTTGTAFAAGHCAGGKTIKDGVLTIATGNPAYFPWVIDDAPESKQGFEAAVAYAVANEMGFTDDAVEWVRSSFDQAIQPGVKDFDLNLQQYSITEDRDKVVDFSEPYYAAAMAAVIRLGAAKGMGPDTASLRGLIWGADANTTAVTMINALIQPERDALLYGDNADVIAAMNANQIDAALFDLPTALYLAAVVLDDAMVIGQFPADRSVNPDKFGMLMEDGNPLKACVDAALQTLKANGALAAIEAKWLQETTDVPIIEE